jgi:putative ABC transport system ATP-binding protein
MSCEKTAEARTVNLTKSFWSGDVETQVLKGVNLELMSGEITVVLGASGSGKSTLLNIIGGIDRPSSGSVFFRDRDISSATDAELTEHRRKNIGFVFQFYNLAPTLTALENVKVSTEVADKPMDPAEALKIVGLDGKMDNFPSQMSGGQQQRVAIARAIAKNPALLLCDEPTGALDAVTGKMILSTLARLNSELGSTIVIITHAAPMADLAHRVARVNSGVVEDIIVNSRRKSVEEINW